MRKRIPTEFGRAVQVRLLDTGMTQEDLIARVKNDYKQFLDSSYLYKILTGQRKAPKVVKAIREVLDLPDQDQSTA